MKQVMIIVRPGCYFKTKQALSDNRFFAMSTKEVLGRGKAFVHFTSGEGKETSAVNEVYENALVAKKLIEMVVPDEAVDSLIQLVLSVNSHGTEATARYLFFRLRKVSVFIRVRQGKMHWYKRKGMILYEKR